MKKIFTLIAAAFVALTASAFNEEWTPSADFGGTATLDHITAQFKNNTSKGSVADQGTWTFSDKDARGDQNALEVDFTPSVRGKLSIVFAAAVATNKSFNMSDNLVATLISDPTVTFESGANPAAEVATEDGVYYILEAGKTYTFYVGGTKWRMRSFSFTDEGLPAAEDPTPSEPTGAKETFQAVTFNGTEYVAADVFTNAVIANGESTVKFGTANMDVVAVGGTTAKDVYQDAGTDFAGWTEWNAVEWKLKSQGDINFGYIEGTGVPAVSFSAEEVLDEGARTGHYRPTYEYFEADGSKGLPTSGVYYKFSPKVAGQLAVAIWVNKGNRITYLVDEATKTPIAYTAEGYINGQNEITGVNEDGSNIYGGKKWLSNDEIKAIHDASNNASNPYIIGAGNQPFWGNVTANVEAGKTYCLFVHNAQIGFQGYEFTVADGIEEIVAAPVAKNNFTYNLAGQRVAASAKGIVIINGKKYINK